MSRHRPTWPEALDTVLASCTALAAAQAELDVSAAGLVLATAVRTQWDLPQANVSVMDGYAARARDLQGDAPVALQRVGESAAGHPWPHTLEAHACVRISTGAVVPDGADIVIPQEDTRLDPDAPGRVTVDLAAFGEVRAGRWVRGQGSDVRAGDVVLPAGLRLQPGDLAMAASTGHTHLSVVPRPRVAIVSTGDELVPRGQTPAAGAVVSSNDLMLAAAVRDAGGTPVDLGIAPDDPAGLRAALERALDFDVVLTTGGISVGDHDLVAQTFAELGVAFSVQGVQMRPGKPVAFGRRASSLVFGLPGNPASAWATFCLLVRPALRVLAGDPGDPRPRAWRFVLRNEARGAGARTHLLRARFFADQTAEVLPTQTSGDLSSLRAVDGLVEVPAGTPSLAAGASVTGYVTNPWWSQTPRPPPPE